jgi:hypothetical protein
MKVGLMDQSSQLQLVEQVEDQALQQNGLCVMSSAWKNLAIEVLGYSLVEISQSFIIF